jgi:membrane protease YdiL (CAAX protease family)
MSSSPITPETVVLPAPANTKPYAPVAPWWHTAIFAVIIVGFSFAQGRPSVLAKAATVPSRMPAYIGTIIYEFFLFGYAWLGLWLRKVHVREVIGGKWNRLSDFLIDFATAIIFAIVVTSVIGTLSYLVHFNGTEAAKPLLPQSIPELVFFTALAVTAGFCEEFVFRGYFMRQFLALTKTPWLAVVLQAVLFGSAHFYQGWRGVFVISVYGALFGILALWRKSLRPGMIQHMGQDSLSGIAGYLLLKYHKI